MLELNEDYSKNAAKVSFISMEPVSGDGELISFDIMPKLPNVTTSEFQFQAMTTNNLTCIDTGKIGMDHATIYRIMIPQIRNTIYGHSGLYPIFVPED